MVAMLMLTKVARTGKGADITLYLPLSFFVLRLIKVKPNGILVST